MDFEETEDATPLEPEEKEDLIPDIQTRQELNEWEQNNILEAKRWLFPTRRSLDRIFTSEFMKMLHEKMFDAVWEWAGQYRNSEKSIGIDPYRVPKEVHKLCDDAEFWVNNNSFDHLEFCARLHHELTYIHPFPNGNGRHARLYTDYVSYCREENRFSWGSGELVEKSETRDQYIEALRMADGRNYKPLMDFMTG